MYDVYYALNYIFYQNLSFRMLTATRQLRNVSPDLISPQLHILPKSQFSHADGYLTVVVIYYSIRMDTFLPVIRHWVENTSYERPELVEPILALFRVMPDAEYLMRDVAGAPNAHIITLNSWCGCF
jgi:hypothetical protein